MSNSVCISGPAFSVKGYLSYTTSDVSFVLAFDSGADADLVLAYDWYLDGELIIDNNLAGFNGTLDCGRHTLGARILSADGWSGVKSVSVNTCLTLLHTNMTGPEWVAQGNTGQFQILDYFDDGSTNDITAEFEFSSELGTFAGGVFTPYPGHDAVNPAGGVTATRNGVPEFTSPVTVVNIVDAVLSGPTEIRQGESGEYTVQGTYYDGYQADITTSYTFDIAGVPGSFTGGTFTPEVTDHRLNPEFYVVATGNYLPDLQVNGMVITVFGTAITGPDPLDRNDTGSYQVIGTFYDGTDDDLTDLFYFQSEDGTVTGNQFIADHIGHVPNPFAELTAYTNDFVTEPLSKQLRIITVYGDPVISGPAIADIAIYNDYGVSVLFYDGLIDDIAAYYTFTSPAGEFTNSQLYINGLPGHPEDPEYTITATSNWDDSEPLTKTIMVRTIINRYINGPDDVLEYLTADYYVISQDYTGYEIDVTDQCILTCPGGTFSGNTFTPAASHEEAMPLVTITATRTGKPDVTREIRVLNLDYEEITGPASVLQGESADYTVQEHYLDGYVKDVTAQFTLASTEGSFSGGTFTPAISDHRVNPVVSVTAHDDMGLYRGVAPKSVTVITVTHTIEGAATVISDMTEAYAAKRTFYDGFEQDVTGSFSFSSPDGTFAGNVFTPVLSGQTADFDTTITATASGFDAVEKTVTIRVVTDVVIDGPATVDAGDTVSYSVMKIFAEGPPEDVTNDYEFSCPQGTFAGNAFTAYEDEPSASAVITAEKAGADPLTKDIEITGQVPGILVVDLLDKTDLNVMAYIANTEVAEHYVPAYTGYNKVPAAATDADAYILASDAMTVNRVKWRIEFNLAKLVADYPETPEFALVIEGWGLTAGELPGAYILKVESAVMTMTGGEGDYIPSATGANLGSLKTFESYVYAGTGGGEGGYGEYGEYGEYGGYGGSGSEMIVTFVYTVATRKVVPYVAFPP